MAIKTRKCLSCQTSFSYCPDCSRIDATKPIWASQFCSEACATLWSTLTKYGMSMITKSEAKSIISSLDLKPIDAYVSCIQRDYTKVMAKEKKQKSGKRIYIQLVDEEVIVHQEQVESIIEELVEDQIDQPIEVVDLVVNDPTEHEVVFKENNE